MGESSFQPKCISITWKVSVNKLALELSENETASFFIIIHLILTDSKFITGLSLILLVLQFAERNFKKRLLKYKRVSQ